MPPKIAGIAEEGQEDKQKKTKKKNKKTTREATEEEQIEVSHTMSGEQVMLLCHFGGNFVLLGNEVTYSGGTTRMALVDRQISYAQLKNAMHGLYNSHAGLLDIKFQYPGRSLAASLVLVENDNDVRNMMESFPQHLNDISLFLFTKQASQTIVPSSILSQTMFGERLMLLCHFDGELVESNKGVYFYRGGSIRTALVDRKIGYNSLLKVICNRCKVSSGLVSIKFQYPGKSLGTCLVSVEDDNDVDNMMESVPQHLSDISLFISEYSDFDPYY